jgi:eukaryotic-like serine/threonine-protein kinase
MSSVDPVIIGGRYELGELLGRGGMAEVRKGTDARLGRAVAVKRLRTDLVGDATFLARFRREAQASASLNHPAIVAVYDTGDEPSADPHGVSQPYIVMEYVAGRTLREILGEGRKILPERALEITAGVLSALDYSHRAGIIHRDIKPGNVMLTPTGDVKVMDFGIARAMSDASAGMTQTAAVVGTAQYLSPEQARGETVDSRSDVYSTGCLLYELLTGRPPFVGDSPVSVAYQHVRELAAPPSAHDPDLPPEVDAIVMKALAKRVEDRYQSAAAMRTDIERLLAGRPVHAPAVEAVEPTYYPPMPVEAPTSTSASALTGTSLGATGEIRDADEDRRRAAWLWGLGALIVALVVAAAILLPRLMEQPPEQVQVPPVVGMSEDEARAAIGEAGLTVGEIDSKADDVVPVDFVISQNPDRDLYVDPDSSVDLVISLGKPEVAVPYIIGMSRKEARTALADENLEVKFEEQESDLPAGTVIDTNPGPGVSVEEGATITAYFSDGPEVVPPVIGLEQDEAIRRLEAADFRVKVLESSDTTEPAGTVIDQVPGADETAPLNSTVTIVVSTYEPEPEPEPTPTPTDDPSGTLSPRPPWRP